MSKIKKYQTGGQAPTFGTTAPGLRWESQVPTSLSDPAQTNVQPTQTNVQKQVETADEALSRILREIDTDKVKNKIVATSGLGSWNEVKDDSTFNTLSAEEQVEYAKQFDPVSTNLNEQFQSRIDETDAAGKVTQRKISSKEFYDANIDNYSTWNKYQQNKFNVLHGQIETREAGELVKKAKDSKLLNASNLAGIKSLNFKHKATNIADEWGYVLGDISGDEPLTEGLVNVLKNIVINPQIKLTDADFNTEKANVIKAVKEYVKTLNPAYIKSDKKFGWEMETYNPITGEPITRFVGGSSEAEARRKLARDIIRGYNKMTEHIGSSNREAKNIYTEKTDISKYKTP